MIKNNFILSESEKNRVLTLHRLPNHKPSYRLNEQTIKVTWPSDKEKTAKDTKSSEGNLEKWKQGGRFTQLDFSDPTKVEQSYDNITSYVNMNYRGNVVNYFYRALLEADKLYSGNGYGDLANKLKTLSDGKTGEMKTSAGSETYNTMINPPEDEEGLYQVAYLKAPFGGVAVWKIKRSVGAESGVDDKKSGFDNNIKTAQEGVIRLLGDATKGIDSELSDALCVDTLQFYLNKVVNKQYPVSGEKLRTLKKTIAYCNTNIKYDPARQQGLFKKIKNKTSGNVYGKLKKKTRTMLDGLQYRNDEFKVNITDPDRN
jgi:hypothetical protein